MGDRLAHAYMTNMTIENSFHNYLKIPHDVDKDKVSIFRLHNFWWSQVHLCESKSKVG
jgi:hypothetical protein